MQKQGLHELSYLLTLDPVEEVKAARDEVASKTWQELSLDERLTEEIPETIEAEVIDAHVLHENNSASYHAEHDLPINYTAQVPPYEEAEDVEVNYGFDHDVFWVQAEKEFSQEMDERVQASILGINFTPTYSTEEQAIRVKNQSICKGSLSFLEYDIKSHSR